MTVTFFSVSPPPAALAAYLLAATASGVFIGATGIGGVLLVPLLLLMSVPVLVASRAVLASFILAGTVALVTHRNFIPRELLINVGGVVLPGALAGGAAG